jgi:hypothetical protein
MQLYHLQMESSIKAQRDGGRVNQDRSNNGLTGNTNTVRVSAPLPTPLCALFRMGQNKAFLTLLL